MMENLLLIILERHEIQLILTCTACTLISLALMAHLVSVCLISVQLLLDNHFVEITKGQDLMKQ